MSINPVSESVSAKEIQVTNRTPQPGKTPDPGKGQPVDLASGLIPNRETHAPQSTPVAQEMPADEVQVQRDPGMNSEIVIKYLDGAGNVILQVPSSQVLEVARAIGQDFQEEAKTRASIGGTQAISKGGETHGH